MLQELLHELVPDLWTPTIFFQDAYKTDHLHLVGNCMSVSAEDKAHEVEVSLAEVMIDSYFQTRSLCTYCFPLKFGDIVLNDLGFACALREALTEPVLSARQLRRSAALFRVIVWDTYYPVNTRLKSTLETLVREAREVLFSHITSPAALALRKDFFADDTTEPRVLYVALHGGLPENWVPAYTSELESYLLLAPYIVGFKADRFLVHVPAEVVETAGLSLRCRAYSTETLFAHEVDTVLTFFKDGLMLTDAISTARALSV